ncbi:hypothetical protein D3C77_423400 [compost metagenome]
MRTLALAGRPPGEAIDQDVHARIALDTRIVVADALQQLIESMQPVARDGRRIHANHGDTTGQQQVEVAIEQRVLQEHHFRS